MLNFFKRKKISTTGNKKDYPEGLWEKCPGCASIIYKKDLNANGKVCPKCGFLFTLTAYERIELLIDEGSFIEINKGIRSADPLNFKDRKKYKDRLKENLQKTSLNDAIVTGTGTIMGLRIAFGVLDFRFMGGSMGSVVGKKITDIIEIAERERLPFLMVSASGGARMQESILSLMQMAKTSAAIARLKKAGLPYISLLTHPTTGGVSASFATLGDVNIAEPKAIIGFAGRRVIEQTIKEQLPPDFQTSEFLLEHGMLDMIVLRKELKGKIHAILSILLKH